MPTAFGTNGILAIALVAALGPSVASPAQAQGIVEMPRFDFPSAEGPWGCRFRNGCRPAEGATAGGEAPRR